MTENNSRYRGSSYGGRGYRVGRPPAVHRHRTLNLNPQTGSAESSPSTPSGSSENTQWVSKTDRHKQLINANVYQQQAQSRAQAIEETRQRKLTQQKSSEKSRFNNFLQRHNNGASSAQGPLEITIEEIRFLVRDGGKKLVRAAGTFYSHAGLPPCLTVAKITLMMRRPLLKLRLCPVSDSIARKQAILSRTELSKTTGMLALSLLMGI